MAQELIRAENGQFAKQIISCEVAGVAVCHIGGKCSQCAYALAKLNPEQPLYFLMSQRRN